MTIEQAIKKAEKIQKDEGVDYSGMTDAEIFMDVVFWQSLGKALGWKEYCQFCGYDHKGTAHPGGWKFEWHRFIDHLAEEKDAESFFKDL